MPEISHCLVGGIPAWISSAVHESRVDVCLMINTQMFRLTPTTFPSAFKNNIASSIDLLSTVPSQACYLPSLPCTHTHLLGNFAFTSPGGTAAQVLQAEYTRRVGIEKAQHDLVCQPIRQRNTERHEAAAHRRQQRTQVDKANGELVLAAEQLHQQRLYEVCPAYSAVKAVTCCACVRCSIVPVHHELCRQCTSSS